MAKAEVKVAVTLQLTIDDPTKAYLVAAGWTPPGEDAPDPRRALAVRREVAEEIREDLLSHAGTALQGSDARFAAQVAMRHAAGRPAGRVADPARCVGCGHPIAQHGPEGCKSDVEGRGGCGCKESYPLANRQRCTCDHDNTFHTASGCIVAGCGCKSPRRPIP